MHWLCSQWNTSRTAICLCKHNRKTSLIFLSLEAILLPCLCFLVCAKKWVEKKQNIPKLFPWSVFQACPFLIQSFPTVSVASLPLSRDCAATWTAIYYSHEWLCNMCDSESISPCFQMYMQNSTHTPWYTSLCHPRHVIFWLALIFLVQPLPII